MIADVPLWCRWLHDSGWATWIRESDIVFPIIEGAHILALSVSIGLVFLFDLRLLGLIFRDVPVSKVMQRFVPWSMPGFIVIFATGLILFATQADKAYSNTFFRWKIAFLILAGLNAAFYQVKYFPHMAAWDVSNKIPGGARGTAVASLILWASIVSFGRNLAYEF